jgi:hypothetical protein
MRHILTATLLILAIKAWTQTNDTVPPLIKDTAWTAHGFFGLNVSQTSLSDWQGGGQNNVSISGIVNLDILYKRDKFERWQNKLDALFGVIRQGGADGPYKGFVKNIDQLFVLSKYNTKAFGKYWFWAGQADYRTQFAPGYESRGDSVVQPAISDINSPGYIQLGFGLDYIPRDYFSISILPLAGKVTLVNRQYLADEGAFGVTPAKRDATGKITSPGKKVRYEAGGRLIFKFKKDIVKNVNLDSYLDLFTNYFVDFGNIDVIFNNTLSIKVARYFSVNLISRLIYDNDIIRKRDLNGDGQYNGEGDIYGPRLQAMTTLAVGIGYKF